MDRLRTLLVCAAVQGLLLSTVAATAQIIAGEQPQSVEDKYVPQPPGISVSTWVSGLEIPWSLIFLPDGRALVSERHGRIRLIAANGTVNPAPYATLKVVTRGEGGLMGLALHPRFPQVPYIYAMLTRSENGTATNAVIRLRHEGDHAVFDRVIIDGIPAGTFHDGGRIAFGPDGMLYIGTGDATYPPLAAGRRSLAGKVLRVTPDGAVPPDNPFPNSPVYSYGHRNVQGLVWRPGTHNLFESEHGPTGEFGLHARDEINLIDKGGNYGWPTATCAAHRVGLIDPLVCWPKAAVPPGGMTFFNGDLLVATLKSEALVRVALTQSNGEYRVAAIERWFATGPAHGRYGRLRDVVLGPDKSLYVLTSNRDGRGTPHAGDDRILKLTPQ